MSSRKYYYYRRPIGDLLEAHRRPTCLIGDPTENSTCFIGDNIPHQRRTCLIGDPSETDMPAESNRNFNKFKYSHFIYILLIYIGIIYWGMSVPDGSPMKHVEVPDRRSGMSVSDNNNIFVNSLLTIIFFVEKNIHLFIFPKIRIFLLRFSFSK